MTLREMLPHVLRILSVTVLWCAALFVSAGRLDWRRGWIAVGLCILTLAINGVIIRRYNPELLRERWKPRKDTKPFDKIFGLVFLPAVFATPIVAGLAERRGTATMPEASLWIGVVLFLAGYAFVGAAMGTNRHLETTVRIQEDRGHQVVTSGPYSLVRHPMYTGIILQQAGTVAMLGAPWAAVPAGVLVLALIVRTALEDRTLRAELPGYEEFTAKTRFRLVPGLW